MALDYKGMREAIRAGARNSLYDDGYKEVAERIRQQTIINMDRKMLDAMIPWPVVIGIDPGWPKDLYPIVQAPVPLKDDLANPAGRASRADLAKPCAPVQSEPDRIWDLIVLAAESSGYGK